MSQEVLVERIAQAMGNSDYAPDWLWSELSSAVQHEYRVIASVMLRRMLDVEVVKLFESIAQVGFEVKWGPGTWESGDVILRASYYEMAIVAVVELLRQAAS